MNDAQRPEAITPDPAAVKAAGLDAATIRASIADLGGPRGLADALVAAATRLSADAAAIARFDAQRGRLAVGEAVFPATEAEGAPAPLIAALLALTSWPAMQRRHRELAVPTTVTRATQADLLLWMHHHHDREGAWGLAQLGWLRHHLFGRLYRLGRLQFTPAVFAGTCSVFRPRTGGAAVLLAEAGMAVRDDGFLRLPADATAASWITTREDSAMAFAGAVVRADGGISREQMELRRAEWERVLAPGDPILEVHIPAGEAMDHDACSAAFSDAPAFFAAHHPEVEWRAFATETWLLDGQLARLLPAESNIVRFLRRFRLYPTTAGDAQAFERVFVTRPADLKRLATATSLQRALAAHLRAGGRLRGGGGVILRDGLR